MAWRLQIQMLPLVGKKALGMLFSQGMVLLPGGLGQMKPGKPLQAVWCPF